MNARFRTILALVSTILGGTFVAAQAQEPLWSRDRAFRIPFEVDPNDRPRLQEIQLYYSSDRGQSWRQYNGSPPGQTDFSFAARGDGEYWFTVRTIDRQGKMYPPTLNGVAPQLKVFVDTTPPEISLRTFNPVGQEVGVEWDILEEHLDIDTLRLEFRTVGSRDWHPVRIDKVPRGRASWELGVSGPIEIRLRVLDKAANEGIKTISLGAPAGIPANQSIPAMPGSDGSTSVPPVPARSEGFSIPSKPRLEAPSQFSQEPDELQPLSPIGSQSSRFSESMGDRPANPPQRYTGVQSIGRPAPTNVELVNSKFFGINYAVEDQGKSGLGSVELFYTYDGQTWSRYGEDEDLVSPFIVEVNEEGVYGFALVVKNGAGVGDDPPSPGDPPQAWIEVDLTPPEVELYPPQPGMGAYEGILTITWNVRDRNLAAKSITLSYSDSPSGPWTKIREGIDNTGRYQWKMPEEVPFKFFLQIEAQDKAGNIGRRITDQPVVVDLSRPKPRILGVEPTRPGL